MFGASRKEKSQLEALRLDVEGLRQEFAALKAKLEGDLESVKKDFREFLLLFDDMSAPDDLPDEALVKKEESDPGKNPPPESGEASAAGKEIPKASSGAGSVLAGHLAEAKGVGAGTDIQLLSEKMESLIKWAEHFEQETKSIKDDIQEARKDIKSKIVYSVSRLKT